MFDPAPSGRLQAFAFALDRDPNDDEPTVELGEIGELAIEVTLRWPVGRR